MLVIPMSMGMASTMMLITALLSVTVIKRIQTVIVSVMSVIPILMVMVSTIMPITALLSKMVTKQI